jgi:predicted AAA+ superfamily ATPase
MRKCEPEEIVRMDEIDIDWSYLLERLERLLDLGEEYLEERLSSFEPDPELFAKFIAFRWRRHGSEGYLEGVAHPDLPDHADLLGIERALSCLRQNTRQFLHSLPANNILLWGERGGGKSSAVKSLLKEFGGQGLRLVEVQKEDLFQLPAIAACLREQSFRFILFCDDLSFDENETGYRELKALLEGGIEARPENVLVYATSNRRHLLPERFQENTGEAEIHPEEAVAEKLSLSDRFGIALGFYPMGQETYLAIVRHLGQRRQLQFSPVKLEAEALRWALARGARSGRVARQFIDDLNGRLALQTMERRSGN